MGNRGHLDKQQRARELRAQAWTLDEIAAELGCAKSSASLWTRGVAFTPKPRNRGIGVTKPHPMHLAKLAEIEQCRRWAADFLGEMSDRDLFMAGLGLYAGDGGNRGLELKVDQITVHDARNEIQLDAKGFEFDRHGTIVL